MEEIKFIQKKISFHSFLMSLIKREQIRQNNTEVPSIFMADTKAISPPTFGRLMSRKKAVRRVSPRIEQNIFNVLHLTPEEIELYRLVNNEDSIPVAYQTLLDDLPRPTAEEFKGRVLERIDEPKRGRTKRSKTTPIGLGDREMLAELVGKCKFTGTFKKIVEACLDGSVIKTQDFKDEEGFDEREGIYRLVLKINKAIGGVKPKLKDENGPIKFKLSVSGFAQAPLKSVYWFRKTVQTKKVGN